ncbi:MAG: hypothetical protein ABI887_17250, partial [Burkholderiales bacterium]
MPQSIQRLPPKKTQPTGQRMSRLSNISSRTRLVVIAALSAGAAACGGGGSSSDSAVGIASSAHAPAPASATDNQSGGFAGQVIGGGSVAAVTVTNAAQMQA